MQVGWNVILPAALSFIGAILGTVISGKRQIQTSAIAAFIPARLEAYRDLEQSLESISSGVSPERARVIYSQINSAMLVASDKTQQCLINLNTLVRLAERGEPVEVLFADEHKKLIDSMRRDLFKYPLPKSEGRVKGI